VFSLLGPLPRGKVSVVHSGVGSPAQALFGVRTQMGHQLDAGSAAGFLLSTVPLAMRESQGGEGGADI
jgi:hypothetical protein